MQMPFAVEVPENAARSDAKNNTFDAIYFSQLLIELCDLQKKNSRLSEALSYHLAAGGGRTRARLTYQVARHCGLPTATAYLLAAIPELLHNASLIHDDIQDASAYRREQPSLWKKFGSDVAICAGDYLLSAAYGLLATPKIKQTAALLHCVHQHVGTLIHGQVNDLTQDESLVDPTIYLTISAQKSGELLAMCFTLPLIEIEQLQHLAAAKQALSHFAIAYQIYDDLNDIETDQAKGALNIVVLLQRKNVADPIEESLTLATGALTQAQAQAALLPLAYQNVINVEIQRLHTKIHQAKPLPHLDASDVRN